MAYQKIITTADFVTQEYKKQNDTDPEPPEEISKTPTFGWRSYATYEVDSVLANYFIENGLAIDFLTEIQNPTLSMPINLMATRVESPVQPAPVVTAAEPVAQAVTLDK